ENTEVVGFLGDDQKVVTMSGTGVRSIVDMGSGQVLNAFRSIPLPAGAPGTLLAGLGNVRYRRAWSYSLSQHGKRLAVSHRNGASIELRDTGADRRIGAVPKSAATDSATVDREMYFEFSSDGNRVLTASTTGALRVWDLTARSQTIRWNAPDRATS